MGLRIEFDFANAPAPALEVIARTGADRSRTAFADAPDKTRNLVDRAKVERLAPDEGLDRIQETLPRGDIARGTARADEGGPLPRQRRALVMRQSRVIADRQRADFRRWP